MFRQLTDQIVLKKEEGSKTAVNVYGTLDYYLLKKDNKIIESSTEIEEILKAIRDLKEIKFKSAAIKILHDLYKIASSFYGLNAYDDFIEYNKDVYSFVITDYDIRIKKNNNEITYNNIDSECLLTIVTALIHEIEQIFN